MKRSGKFNEKVSKKRRTESQIGDSGYDQENVAPCQAQSPDLNIIRNNDNPVCEGGFRCGTLKEIQVVNFLCHDNLRLPITKSVQFIIGKNGSGKSAVLTALIVALGGKASTTTRGSSLRSFVKHGKQAATVSVTLHNQGMLAYRPGLYGSSITVQRRITTDGSSSYKLLSQNKVVISTKRRDLLDITSRFNIQVDNPVIILTQETSKTFLHSNGSTGRYSLFLDGTRMSEIRDSYLSSEENAKESKRVLADKYVAVQELEQKMLLWKKKKADMGKIDQLGQSINHLKDLLVWSLIRDEEEREKEIAQQLEKLQAVHPKMEEKKQCFQAKLSEAETKKKQVHEELIKVNEKTKAIAPEGGEWKQKVQDSKNLLRDKQREQHQLESAMRRSKEEKLTISSTIERLEQSIVHLEEEGRQRKENMTEITKKIEAQKALKLNLEQQLDLFSGSVQQTKIKDEHLRADERQLSISVQALTRQVNAVRQNENSHLGKFGDGALLISQKIEEGWKAKKFKEKPRGPFGQYIKLKDEKWGIGVEGCLKGLIYAYAVDNHGDEKVLEKMMGSHSAMIITSRYVSHIHEVSKSRPQCQYPTVMDMIEVDDPIVMNFLIDQAGVESILLIAENQEAIGFMMYHAPPSVRGAYTKEGHQLFSKPTFRYFANSRPRRPVLTTSLKERLFSLEEELQSTIQQLEQKKIEIRQHNTETVQQKNQVRTLEKRLTTTEKDCQQLQRQYRSLEQVDEPNPYDMSSLEHDLKEATKKISGIESKLNTVVDEKYALEKELEILTKELNDHRTSMSKISSLGDPLKLSLEECEKTITHSKAAIASLKKKEIELDGRIKEVREAHDSLEKTIAKNITKALEKSPRIESDKTQSALIAEVKEKEKRLAQGISDAGHDPTEVVSIYDEKKAAYLLAKRNYKKAEALIVKLEKSIAMRKSHWTLALQHVSARVASYFSQFIMQAGYHGSISFDHKANTIAMKVVPREDGADDRARRDVRGLSGGERSFTTVCFICAIWQNLFTPFKCLDEFDIFQDMVNRRISVNRLLSIAEMNRDQQLILLTPNDVPDLDEERPFVGVARMSDPRNT